MAADLGGSQISALLESVPGIRNVLRSPVADALVNMIRAAADLRPFASADAEELIQYAVRRGLINESEGEQVLDEVKGTGSGGARGTTSGGRKSASGARKAKQASHTPAKRSPPRKPAARKAPSGRKPVKKR